MGAISKILEKISGADKARRYAHAREVAKKPSASEGSPITAQTNIMEVVHNYPEAVPVLMEAGLHCIGCQLSLFDSVEQGCALHGMDSQAVENLVKEMNERIKNFRSKK